MYDLDIAQSCTTRFYLIQHALIEGEDIYIYILTVKINVQCMNECVVGYVIETDYFSFILDPR